MTVGFRVLNRKRCVDLQWLEKFRDLPVANVSDSMHRLYGAGPRLRPMHRKGPMIGRALTVRTPPGDNLMLHKALNMAGPNDVIVVDAEGDLTHALLGGIMTDFAMRRGVAGIVLNGAIRDADAIYDFNLPMYAAGVSHQGPYRSGPGEVNVTIAIGSMIVAPGDLVLGDGDGVVVVPMDHVEEIHQRTVAKQKAETLQIKAVADGTYGRDWVDKSLTGLGCEMPES
ncbi:MAG: RraA family protein [Marinosulfonomonas sp.]|nr:RraA family protein [Marinosulfonomonas sp.]